MIHFWISASLQMTFYLGWASMTSTVCQSLISTLTGRFKSWQAIRNSIQRPSSTTWPSWGSMSPSSTSRTSFPFAFRKTIGPWSEKRLGSPDGAGSMKVKILIFLKTYKGSRKFVVVEEVVEWSLPAPEIFDLNYSNLYVWLFVII